MSKGNDCWYAGTSDSRFWCEHDAALRVEGHSPWRELEAVCRREGLNILWAEVALGRHSARIEAEGYPLTCGYTLTETMVLYPAVPLWQFETPPGQQGCPLAPPLPRPAGKFRWVRRDEPERSLWAVVGQDAVAVGIPTPEGSECIRCGMCCWDWKTGDKANRCQHLAEDMRTCNVWTRLDDPRINRPECRTWMQPHQAVDLPDNCGWVRYWVETGVIPPRD